jgi:hypothetical protein
MPSDLSPALDRRQRAAIALSETRGWNAETHAQLAKLARDGKTSGEVSKIMQKSRSSVCAKAARLGITFSHGRRGPEPSERKPRKTRAKPAIPPPAPPPDLTIPPEGVPLEALRHRMCRWVVSSEPYLFCAQPKDGETRSFCRKHSLLAYRQDQPGDITRLKFNESRTRAVAKPSGW